MTKDTPVAAIVDGKLRELSYKLKGDATLEPVKVSSVIGFDMYKRSLLLLMFKAFHDVLGDAEYTTHVLYSLGKGYFCTLTSKEVSVNDELLDKKKKQDEGTGIRKYSDNQEDYADCRCGRVFLKA